MLQTELSPAVVVHSETAHLTLFAGLTNASLSAPTFVAWATRNGPRSFQPGEALDVSVMAENWVLVWWAGAAGWTNWDCPWVVYLQHKPDSMRLDADGLHMDFPKRAGDVVMMPLYGYEKLALQGGDFRAAHRLPEPKVPIKTWEWSKVIPRDPLTRVRYWGAATRDFPVGVDEEVRVDGAADALTIRYQFQRLHIADDWRSRRIKLAPLSPAFALAVKAGGFPLRFSERWFDLELPTLFGPTFGIEDVDGYELTVPILHYVGTTTVTFPSAAPAMVGPESIWLGVLSGGDVASARSQWPGLRPLLGRSGAVNWAMAAGEARDGQSLGAARALALARLACVAGDEDDWARACRDVVGELLALFIRERGGEFMHQHQPWHGWRITARHGEVLERATADGGWEFLVPELRERRWTSAPDADVARFLWDVAGRNLAGEFFSERTNLSASIAGGGTIDAWRSAFAPLKAAAEAAGAGGLIRGTRLFSPLPTGRFVPLDGAPAHAGVFAPTLLVTVRAGDSNGGSWPSLMWPHWRTPTGVPWTFGEIRPVPSGSSRASESVKMGRSSRAVVSHPSRP